MTRYAVAWPVPQPDCASQRPREARSRAAARTSGTPKKAHTMATLDHIILRNDLDASVAFYTGVLGFSAEGVDGPFTLVRAGPDVLIQMAPWVRPVLSTMHSQFQRQTSKAYSVGSRQRTSRTGRRFDSVGGNAGPGEESGARGVAPTLYFNAPNKHLLEIRTYER
jgi:catechol 2,3-dioxygenase-like lactoylglutathione lyase family enzyme